jgi:DNA gyrase/topoisomerase IV subunit A
MRLLFADHDMTSGRNAIDAHVQDVMLHEELLRSVLKHSHSDIIRRTLLEISDGLIRRLVVVGQA